MYVVIVWNYSGLLNRFWYKWLIEGTPSCVWGSALYISDLPDAYNFSRSQGKRGSPVLWTTEGRFPYQLQRAELQWRQQPVKVSSLRLQLLPGPPEGATRPSKLQPPTQGRLLQVLYFPFLSISICWKRKDKSPTWKGLEGIKVARHN